MELCLRRPGAVLLLRGLLVGPASRRLLCLEARRAPCAAARPGHLVAGDGAGTSDGIYHTQPGLQQVGLVHTGIVGVSSPNRSSPVQCPSSPIIHVMCAVVQ